MKIFRITKLGNGTTGDWVVTLGTGLTVNGTKTSGDYAVCVF